MWNRLSIAVDDVLHVTAIPGAHGGAQDTRESVVAPFPVVCPLCLLVAPADGIHRLLGVQIPWSPEDVHNVHCIEADVVVPELQLRPEAVHVTSHGWRVIVLLMLQSDALRRTNALLTIAGVACGK